MPAAGTPRDVLGLIAAAGRATRLAPLPCSKEILPVGFRVDPRDGQARPKPVSLYLVEQMQRAGASRLFFVIRPGKWDIADWYGDGSRFGLSIAYLLMGEPWGPPFTASQVAPFAGEATVVFGFPDLLLAPADAMARAVARLDATGADCVLGICPMAHTGARVDIVDVDANGRVVRLQPKEDRPVHGPDDWSYTLAAWRPSFTRFLREETARLAARARALPPDPAPEWPFGAVIAAAVRAGLHVDSVGGRDWYMLDTGTPAGLVAGQRFAGVWMGEGEPPPITPSRWSPT